MTINPTNLAATAQLTFNDDFNSLSLWNGSSGTWSTTFWYQDPNGAGATIATTGEQEWYINANYGPTASVRPWTVNNGVLTLTAAPASAAIQASTSGLSYTSGELNSFHSFVQTYGYFEMTAKMPAGQGFWPAFWLMPASGQSVPEIDVVETRSNNPTNTSGTAHSPSMGMISNNATVADTTAGFHTYGMDWEPDFITWYFDGQKVFQSATPADMNVPMYMIVNLAAGGFGGGTDGVSSGQMQIQDIRVYKALGDPSQPSGTSYNAATDTVTTNANYILPSGVHNLVLTGQAQTVYGNDQGDTITSNNGNNHLIGGAGADLLIAGRGHDFLTGGAGADTFAYGQFPWDTGSITDFAPGQDRIDLRTMLTSAGYTGSNPVGDGYLKLITDGAGDTQVWFYPSGPSGGAYWVFNILGVTASQLQFQGDIIVGAGSGPIVTPPVVTPPPVTTPPVTTPPVVGGSGPVYIGDAAYTAPGGVTNIVLTGSGQTVHANDAGDTITSTNAANRIYGGTGADTLNLGRGGDVATGGGGNDTFAFKEVPWAAGRITDFGAGDVLDLNGVFSRYGYAAANPLSDGRLTLVADGAGGTQVWFNTSGLSGGSGAWLITTLDGVAASNLQMSSGHLTAASGSAGSSGGGGQTFVLDNSGAHLSGTAAADTFVLGRGGNVVAGAGGADTFVFNEVPWAGGHITDFNAGDTLDLSAMLSRYGYSGSNPLGDGHLKLTADGAGGVQVWFDMSGLSGGSGTWLVTTLDGVSASSLQLAGGRFTVGAGSGSAAGQTLILDNSGASVTGTTGDDIITLGRGGNIVAGGGGNDVFVFNETPWAGGHITDFGAGDTLKLSAMFTRYGYTGSDPIGDGHIRLAADGAGGTQVWFNMDRLSGASGNWLVTTLDHITPSSVHLSAGWITV
jgi:beta-glucanase (GH16 family)